jgi:hypothetical protein
VAIVPPAVKTSKAPAPAATPAPTPTPTPAPVPVVALPAPDLAAVVIPADVKPGRPRKKIGTRPIRAVSTTARAFSFPVALLARLDRFGLGQTERAGKRFNFSAYVTLVIDADLTKRGF